MPAQAWNRLWTTELPSCPAQNNNSYHRINHGEVWIVIVLPLLATPNNSSHREAVGPLLFPVRQCQ